jgi:hypothetical protein
VIYIQEAHPADGWQVESNLRDQLEFAQPKELQERLELALTCTQRLALTIPLLLDTMANEADRAYQGWPERLYVIDTEGRIAYQGGKGPYGFKPDELRAFLESYG